MEQKGKMRSSDGRFYDFVPKSRLRLRELAKVKDRISIERLPFLLINLSTASPQFSWKLQGKVSFVVDETRFLHKLYFRCFSLIRGAFLEL